MSFSLFQDENTVKMDTFVMIVAVKFCCMTVVIIIIRGRRDVMHKYRW